MTKTAIKIAFGILISLIFISFGAMFTQAQSNSCPSLAPYLCKNGSCTNEPSLCDQSWGGGLSNQNSSAENATTSGIPLGQTLAPATPSTEQCTGNLRYDKEAAEKCARLAESEGRARGYNITCTTEIRESVMAVNATPIGVENMYFSNCTINGQTGFSPETLVGYKGSGAGIAVHDNFFGVTTVYGSGFNINSMWYSVPCALVDGIEGKSGTLVGSHTCTAGATQYFGSGSASNWTPANAKKSSGQNTNSGGTMNFFQPTTTANTSGGTSVTANTTLSAQIKSLVALLNKMLEQARNAYGIHLINNAALPSTGTTPGAIVIPTTTLPNYLFELTTDKTSYCVGETPKFTITGPSSNVGSKILWSSWLNGQSTNEFDIDYGHKLGGSSSGAFWSDYGSTWNSTHVGQWTKQANINGLLKNVHFEVKNCSGNTTTNGGTATTNSLVCSPKTQYVGKYTVAYITVADSTNPNFDWSALYNWVAPGSTKVFGQGINFGTSYATPGTYTIYVTHENMTDSCEVTIN